AGARATIAPDTHANANGEFVIRRGDVIQLVNVAPGLQLTTRARTLGNAAIGDSVRLVNLQSNRTVEAIVTGPGAAAASAP
ncbi:MAG: flagella basal body P-ring formation protein FlgA, partial [Hyphomonadaceae bacterium]